MTDEEAARAAATPALIVYGEFVEPVKAEPPYKAWSRIRIIHVYKGSAAVGSRMTLMSDACMIGLFNSAIPAGNRAYVAISPAGEGKGFYHFVSGEKLFRHGIIKGRRFPDPKTTPHGLGESNYMRPSNGG